MEVNRVAGVLVVAVAMPFTKRFDLHPPPPAPLNLAPTLEP